MNVDHIETKCQELKCNAPRVSKADIEARIVAVDYVTTKISGQIFMHCYITLDNGWVAQGEPSVAVSVENFREEIGRDISYQNAFRTLWPSMAYELRERLYKEAKC